jgi:hypothetical protein
MSTDLQSSEIAFPVNLGGRLLGSMSGSQECSLGILCGVTDESENNFHANCCRIEYTTKKCSKRIIR